MTKTLLSTSILILITYLSLPLKGQMSTNYIHNSLKKIWSSDKKLATPESVIYYEMTDLLYISNVNGDPAEKDGNGFISKMSIDGKIINLKWINGLDAPKGMAIYNGKLYVSDIDHLIEIDIEQGKIVKRYEGKNALFLNDVAADKDGNVYVSEMHTNKIYRLKKGKFEIWLEVGNLFQPNGLLVENNKLLVGCKDYVVSVDLNTKHVRSYITETGSIDGLVKNGNEQYLISDWTGNIYLIDKKNPKLKILSTENEKVNAADIEFIPTKKLLLVPTFFDNRIEAYEVNLVY